MFKNHTHRTTSRRRPARAYSNEWARPYIGIPFTDHGRDRTACDCWGLFRLVLKEQCGIDIPSFAETYDRTTNAGAIESAMAANMNPWRPINPGDEQPFDGILLSMKGRATHVGIIVEPGLMLHIEAGINAAVEDYRDLKWCRRVRGFYRHERLGSGDGK